MSQKFLGKAFEFIRAPSSYHTKRSTPACKDDSNARTTGRSEQGRNGRGRNIIGAETALDGSPKIDRATGPDIRLVNIAENYAEENGIDFKRQAEYVTISD